MKKIISLLLITIILSSSLTFLTSCPSNGQNGGKTTIRFWASGMETLTSSLQEIVNEFNATHDDIEVVFQPRPVDGYYDTLQNVLSFSSAPDVFLMEDRYVKKWAKMNLLYDITDKYENDAVLDADDMWPGIIERFRYDTAKNISTEDSTLYGLPCGNNPSVVYYNKSMFERMGITVISKDYSDDLPESEKHGFYRSGTPGTIPTRDETLIFNNRIPMTWEELVDLSMYLNTAYNNDSQLTLNSNKVYGFYSHWWFNFGWSVGGDCIKYDAATESWKFTLGDKTNLTNSEGVKLPSMYDALEFYLNMIRTKAQGGLELMPTQADVDVLGNDVYFMNERVAMLVDVSEKIAVFQNECDFEWDIAPVPKHKDGVEACHSQTTGIAIWKKTKHADAAYEFAQYLASPEVQKKLALNGNFVPNQRSVAFDDVYSQGGMIPANSILLAEACQYARPGDWTYMPDDAWLSDWAPLLNSSVRNNEITLDEFFKIVTNNVNTTLSRYQTNE